MPLAPAVTPAAAHARVRRVGTRAQNSAQRKKKISNGAHSADPGPPPRIAGWERSPRTANIFFHALVAGTSRYRKPSRSQAHISGGRWARDRAMAAVGCDAAASEVAPGGDWSTMGGETRCGACTPGDSKLTSRAPDTPAKLAQTSGARTASTGSKMRCWLLIGQWWNEGVARDRLCQCLIVSD